MTIRSTTPRSRRISVVVCVALIAGLAAGFRVESGDSSAATVQPGTASDRSGAVRPGGSVRRSTRSGVAKPAPANRDAPRTVGVGALIGYGLA